MKNAIQQFLRDEEGAAAVEYGLLAGLISVMIIVGAGTMGTQLKNIFTTIGTVLTNASTNATNNSGAGGGGGNGG
jgi:pilus assembly protein Flp/PilA